MERENRGKCSTVMETEEERKYRQREKEKEIESDGQGPKDVETKKDTQYR
jgi:hypothetical protein